MSKTKIIFTLLKSVKDELKKRLFRDIRLLQKDSSDLKESLALIKTAFESSNAALKIVEGELLSIGRENLELKEENVKLKNEIEEMKDRLRFLEQYTRRKNLEIMGIPKTPGEDVKGLVRAVGAALGVGIEDGQISSVLRVQSFRRANPSLVVRFSDRAIRDLFLRKFKEKKITLREVNPAFPEQRIFVFEHLSPENKVFLFRLKERCREVNYKYAWSRDGHFYVRRTDREDRQRITSYEDLANLK